VRVWSEKWAYLDNRHHSTPMWVSFSSSFSSSTLSHLLFVAGTITNPIGHNMVLIVISCCFCFSLYLIFLMYNNPDSTPLQTVDTKLHSTTKKMKTKSDSSHMRSSVQLGCCAAAASVHWTFLKFRLLSLTLSSAQHTSP